MLAKDFERKCMVDIFSPATFDDEQMNCPRCDWKGRGDDTIVIDFYGLSRHQEVRCPECDAVLGGVSRENNDRDAGF